MPSETDPRYGALLRENEQLKILLADRLLESLAAVPAPGPDAVPGATPDLAARWREAFGRPAAPEPARTTLAEWLDRWLAEEVQGNVRPRTYGAYEATVRRHLIPALGATVLRELSAADVRGFMKAQVEAGFGAETVHAQHSILRRALQVAMRYDLVERNVARLVSPPRVVAGEVKPLTREETLKFLETAAGHRLNALFVLATASGMRLGELTGLTWAATDLERGYVRVDHLLARYGGDYHLDPPKTAKSRRAIAVPQPVVQALMAHRARQREAQATRRWEGNPWDLVFTTETGRPLSSSTVQVTFVRLLEQAGLRRVRFHDLRHGAATLMLAQGVQMKVVQDILGHAQISMTADRYSHVVPELRREAADRIAGALFEDAS